MNFATAVKTGFTKYAAVSGRASRSEFWWFTLFLFGANIVTGFADSILGTTIQIGDQASDEIGYLSLIWTLIIILPSSAIAVRRLHDRDRSGWWYWIMVIPLVGAIWLLIWYCQRGTPGPNRYGPDPLASATNWPIAQT